MTDRRDPSGADDAIRAWLQAGPEAAPPPFVESTVAPIPTMGQRRRSLVAIGRLTVTVRQMLTAAVLLVAILVVAGGVALLSGTSGLGPASRGSSAPSTRSTAPPSSTLPTIALTGPGPLGRGTGVEQGVAGTYETRLFRPRIAFTVPAGWSVGNIVPSGWDEASDLLPIENGAGALLIEAPTVLRPTTENVPLPTDPIAWLRADPALRLSEPRSVSIAGRPAVEIEGTLAPAAPLDADGMYRLTEGLALLPRHHFRIAVVELGGRTVLVQTLADSTRWEAFRPVADAVIATIRTTVP